MIPRSPPQRQPVEASSSTTDASIHIQPTSENGEPGTHGTFERNTSQSAQDKASKRMTLDLPLNPPRTRSVEPVVGLPHPIATKMRGHFRSPAPDPSQARIAYYDDNIRTLIMEKDKALKAAKDAEEARNIALKEI